MIIVYLASIIYNLIAWNLPKDIWIDSQIVVLTGNMEINPDPRNNTFSDQGCWICHWKFMDISTYVHEILSVIIIHFYPQVCYFFLHSETEIPSNFNLSIVEEDHPFHSFDLFWDAIWGIHKRKCNIDELIYEGIHTIWGK